MQLCSIYHDSLAVHSVVSCVSIIVEHFSWHKERVVFVISFQLKELNKMLKARSRMVDKQSSLRDKVGSIDIATQKELKL